MTGNMMKYAAAVFAVVILAVGCSTPKKEQELKTAPKADPAPPTISMDDGFMVDEGAHFELPNEFWYVTGKLDSEEGPYYFTAHFHKAGNSYIHTRNGYNSLRAPDGKYDYRSFGLLVKVLAENKLKEKIEKFPDDTRYPDILAKLQSNESEHFSLLEEDKRGLHRGKLFIDFGNNHFERVSDEKLEYDLKLDTWAGALDLKMEASTDPLTFPSKSPLRMGDGNMQGYFFPRVKVSGTLKGEDGETELTGTAWYNHIFGKPDKAVSARHEIITQRLENGAAFVIANYYDSFGELGSSNIAYMNPDGSVVRDWTADVKPIKSWNSGISRFSYPISWKIEGGDISGVVEPQFEESELMIDEGVGTFWLGPCTFNGKIDGKLLGGKVSGDGFCKVTGTEEKPEP
ncbi:lipocalin-like domain-containing protein [bacterium]